MKKIKAIRHRIEQKTADRKHARQRRRHLFRQEAAKSRATRQIDPGTIIRNTPMPMAEKKSRNL